MSAVEKLISPQEYLEIERASPVKHEYHAGRMYAMAGASLHHNLIVGNVFGVLHAQLAGSPCVPFVSDLRVKIEALSSYVYPDIVVACGELQCEDRNRDTLLNPRLIVEVLSPSTEAYDRGEKFRLYQTIPSLQEYVLVAQDTHVVERFSRGEEGRWVHCEARGIDATLELPSVGCQLELCRIYDRVGLLPAAPGKRSGNDGAGSA